MEKICGCNRCQPKEKLVRAHNAVRALDVLPVPCFDEKPPFVCEGEPDHLPV